MPKARTPLQISDEIADFCATLAPESTPVFVPIKPAPNADPNDCFNVVSNRVKNNGGQMVIGWQIWETPGVVLEAEFHAVWRHPKKNTLMDLTPKSIRTPQVLFLADPQRTYDDRQVKPILRPLTSLPEAHDWIAAFDALFEFMNRGERANQHGRIVLSASEQNEAIQIQRRLTETRLALDAAVARQGQGARYGAR